MRALRAKSFLRTGAPLAYDLEQIHLGEICLRPGELNDCEELHDQKQHRSSVGAGKE
jgi:hypothetical protein